MKITCAPKDIRLTTGAGNRLAVANITLDNAFVVRGLNVMNSSRGIFVSMPSQKGVDQNGNTQYYDTAFPLSKELRNNISNAVLGAYYEKVNEMQNNTQQTDANAPVEEDAESEEDDANEMY